jgi:hypothetical protein
LGSKESSLGTRGTSLAAPVRAACDSARRQVSFHRSTDAHAFQHRLDDEIRIIEGNRSVRIDRDCPAAFLKLPAIHSVRKSEPDAGVFFQVLRSLRNWVRLEIGRRTRHGQAHLSCDANGYHVPLDLFAELYASVILARDEVDRIIGTGDLQDDFRVPIRSSALPSTGSSPRMESRLARDAEMRGGMANGWDRPVLPARSAQYPVRT